MSTVTTVSVRVIGPNQEESRGEVQLISWTQAERTRRALKIWGIGTLASLVVVPVPLVHLLGALGILTMPFVAYYFYSKTTAVVGGKSQCPCCKAELPIAAGKEEWPLKDLCTACRRNLVLERVE